MGVDEGQNSSDTSVHTRLVRLRTAITPRNQSNENPSAGVDKRATAITLARVLSTSGETCADHVGSDSRLTVIGPACCARHNGDIDLLESGGKSGSTFG